MKPSRKIIKIITLSAALLAVAVLLVLSLSAHPGRTDSQGGHWNHSTGEYHYHHGYTAHKHYDIDGDGDIDCPYGYVNNESSNSNNKNSKDNDETTPVTQIKPNASNNSDKSQLIYILIGSIAVAVFILAFSFRKKIKEWLSHFFE